MVEGRLDGGRQRDPFHGREDSLGINSLCEKTWFITQPALQIGPEGKGVSKNGAGRIG